MQLEGKHIVITGASSGIGYEVLMRLSQFKDSKIIAVARHIQNIPIKDNIFPYSADVSTKDGVDSLFSYACQLFEYIDIFIANAGFAYLEKIENADWQHIQQIYALNVFSPIYSLEKLIDNKRKVLFACTISGAGLVSLPGYSLYCSTKAALHHFIETYRYEKEQNLHITAIYPVATHTDFFDKAAGKLATPLPFPQQKAEIVAKSIIQGIIKEKKHIYPSTIFRLIYPIGRAFPFMLKIYSIIEKRKLKSWIN